MISKIYNWLNDHEMEILAELEEMVNTETPSDRKDLLDLFSISLAQKFSDLGAETKFILESKAGNHLKVEYGQGEKQALILCHFDTVFAAGTVAQRPFTYDADKKIARGPGVLDMKAGIISALWAIKAFEALEISPEVKVVLLFNSDEEVGSRSSRPYIEEEAKKSDVVFVLEPGIGPEGTYKLWRKGTGGFRVNITGKASHAGANPEEGISAIDELSYLIQKIHALNNPLTGTTLNVGVVGGGTRGNVVAQDAWAQVDLRVMTAQEGERVVREVLAIEPTGQAQIEITGGLSRPPMEITEAATALYEKATALAKELGYSYDQGGTGGGSDGNFTAALGITTLDGMGGVGHGAHSEEEYILTEHLTVRTAIIAEMIRQIGQK
ncbi:MAG: M20 family metallopeptidase [Firmicutes bacterium]|nr:M20 family metallopeptidase [Bacillota bacterium]